MQVQEASRKREETKSTRQAKRDEIRDASGIRQEARGKRQGQEATRAARSTSIFSYLGKLSNISEHTQNNRNTP